MKRTLLATLVAAFCLSSVFGQDECSGAIPLVLGVNPAPAASGNFFTNVGSTTSAGVVAACQVSNSDVWFSFTPGVSGDYTFSTNRPEGYTAGTLTNTVLSVYDTCPPVTELGCDNDNGVLSTSAVRVNGLVASSTYYVRVADQAATVFTGTFYLNVNPAITNDECSSPIPLTLGTTGNLFTNEGATSSVMAAPACQSSVNSDVWFSFTAPYSGAYIFSTDTPAGFPTGMITDTIVTVYDSCGPAMLELGCDDDGGTVGALLSSLVLPNLVAGNTYLVRVSEYSTSIDQGSFYLDVSRKFDLGISSPGGAGTIQIALTAGPPNALYFLPITGNAGLFPNGYFYGLDIGIQEIVDQVNVGFPFVGNLDAGGNMILGPIGGVPPLTLYSVGLVFTNGLQVASAKTAPVTHTVQ